MFEKRIEYTRGRFDASSSKFSSSVCSLFCEFFRVNRLWKISEISCDNIDVLLCSQHLISMLAKKLNLYFRSIDSDPDNVKSIMAGLNASFAGGSLKIFRILNSALRSTGSLFVAIVGRSTFLREIIANIFWVLTIRCEPASHCG